MSPRQVGAQGGTRSAGERFGDEGSEMERGPPSPAAHAVPEVGHGDGLAGRAEAVPACAGLQSHGTVPRAIPLWPWEQTLPALSPRDFPRADPAHPISSQSHSSPICSQPQGISLEMRARRSAC